VVKIYAIDADRLIITETKKPGKSFRAFTHCKFLILLAGVLTGGGLANYNTEPLVVIY
jgi:hypothetical protein